jgi:hypothetical protein
LRRQGLTESELTVTLQVINVERCQPPLDEAEVATIAHSVARYLPAPEWPMLDPAALTGLAGRFVAAVDPYTVADPVAILIHLLAAVGNIIGDGPHAIAGQDCHPCRVFGLLVGETSRGRKGTAWSVVRTILERLDGGTWARANVKTGLSSGEGVIHHVRDRVTGTREVKGRQRDEPIRYEEYIVDHGVEDKRLFVIEPEMASVLKRMAGETNTLSPLLRQAWDSGDLGTLTRTNPIRATGAHLSLIGHITTDELLRTLTETEQANGFANRILFLCVRRSKFLPEGASIPPAVLVPLLDDFRRVQSLARRVRVIVRDPAATARWHAVYPELTREITGLVGASLRAAKPKRSAYPYSMPSSIGARWCGSSTWRPRWPSGTSRRTQPASSTAIGSARARRTRSSKPCASRRCPRPTSTSSSDATSAGRQSTRP